MAFVHLHNHTEYSLLDGLTHIKDMVRRAASLPTALPFRHFLGCHDTSLSLHGVRTNSEFCME